MRETVIRSDVRSTARSDMPRVVIGSLICFSIVFLLINRKLVDPLSVNRSFVYHLLW